MQRQMRGQVTGAVPGFEIVSSPEECIGFDQNQTRAKP